MRCSLRDGERSVPGRSGQQVSQEPDVGEAVQQGQDAGVIPEETVRLCGGCDGAAWIGKHVQALFPHARQGLDSYPCAESLPQGAKAQ